HDGSHAGRRLYPLLRSAGFHDVRVEPRMVYVDSSRPHLVEGFSKNTFTAMVEGAREKSFEFGLTDEGRWEKGIADLYRATEADGVFCYTFFRGRGIAPTNTG
ncbi:MAG: SAM-dependent methyltransferase, partial [Candidatus Hydrogenedentes bacterium]|nr:SAM-dependent methyltransferase [Candidatus Hydrogenedentota bacterium]